MNFCLLRQVISEQPQCLANQALKDFQAFLFLIQNQKIQTLVNHDELAKTENCGTLGLAEGFEMSHITVFEAKRIVTLDDTCPSASHVAVRDGRILAIGGPDCADPWGSVQHDTRLADTILTPGFVEGHAHMMAGSIWRFAYAGYHDRIEVEIVFVVDFNHDITSRATTHGEEYVFLEDPLGTIQSKSIAPRLEVSRHGIDECTVTIENHSVIAAVWNGDFTDADHCGRRSKGPSW